MRRHLPLILILIVLVIGGYFILNINLNRQPVGSSEGFVTSSEQTPEGSEEGRTIKNFGAILPAVFPETMPIEPNPIRIIKNSGEFIGGDVMAGEPGYAQYNYVYVTDKAGKDVVSDFETYFEEEGYAVKTDSDEK